MKLLVERGIVRIGTEIEVPAWENGRNFKRVAADLMAANYMPDDGNGWNTVHKYGCKCKNVCAAVRRGDVFIPPLVSLTYDASLPDGGGEFVVSPVFLFDHGLDALREVWDIVVKDALWTDELPNKRGDGMCSPSIHLHVSATKPDDGQNNVKPTHYFDPTRLQPPQDVQEHDDITHALVLYGPELLALASTCGIQRGLFFRKPVRKADQRGHHGLIHVRNVTEDMVHIEWRLFEAAYSDWDYVESAAYLAAGLTRGLLGEDTFSALMAGGYGNPYNRMELETAVAQDNTAAALRLADVDRLRNLYEICVAEIDDDPNGIVKLDAMFASAERLIANA